MEHQDLPNSQLNTFTDEINTVGDLKIIVKNLTNGVMIATH
jgi:hypothetical protein